MSMHGTCTYSLEWYIIVLIKKYFHGVHVVFMISWSLHQCDIACSLHSITFINYLKWFKTCLYYVMHNICLPQYKKLEFFISVKFSGTDFSCDILDCLADFHFGDYCFLDWIKRLVIVYLLSSAICKQKGIWNHIFSVNLCSV